MQLSNYNLKVGNKTLLTNLNIKFKEGQINHILGRNGIGKSMFIKDLITNSKYKNEISIISSYSNIPENLKVKDILKILKNNDSYNQLYKLLNICDIDEKLLIQKLSDGQKQKIKIMTYFTENKKILILDELTNALDQKTVNEIYNFLNEYILYNKEKTIINITHNLQDLKKLNGLYYIFKDYNIFKTNVDECVKYYIGEN